LQFFDRQPHFTDTGDYRRAQFQFCPKIFQNGAFSAANVALLGNIFRQKENFPTGTNLRKGHFLSPPRATHQHTCVPNPNVQLTAATARRKFVVVDRFDLSISKSRSMEPITEAYFCHKRLPSAMRSRYISGDFIIPARQCPVTKHTGTIWPEPYDLPSFPSFKILYVCCDTAYF